MRTRTKPVRPFLVAVVAASSVAGLAAAPAQARKPAPPPPPTTTLPTYATSVVGVSPSALAKPTASGKTIRSLTMDNGTFYVGHGDYIGNSGPTKVSTFDPATRTFTESGLTAPTEEITTFRKIGGKLYAPWTDPTGSPGVNQGFSTNASGAWTNEFAAPAEHVYDVASLNGTDLWMVGSAKGIVGTKGGAAAYRSTDGGKAWSLVATDTSVTETGRERYYWAAALGGKMYLQASDVSEGAPLRVFDGTRWSTMAGVNPCHTVEARAVEVFNNKIICTNYAKGVVAFDGQKATTVLPTTGWNVLDFDIPGDGYIYALAGDGIFRSPDGLTWTGVAKTPDLSWSIGVHDGTVYLGQRLNATIVKLDGLNLNAPTTDPCKKQYKKTQKQGKHC